MVTSGVLGKAMRIISDRRGSKRGRDGRGRLGGGRARRAQTETPRGRKEARAAENEGATINIDERAAKYPWWRGGFGMCLAPLPAAKWQTRHLWLALCGRRAVQSGVYIAVKRWLSGRLSGIP